MQYIAGGFNIKKDTILYISYNGALEPLVQSQVISYLKELSKKGLNFVLVTFDKKKHMKNKREVIKLKQKLKKANIKWVSLKYHNRPNLPSTLYDILNGFLLCSKIIRKYNIKTVHARSYVAGLMALFLKRRFNTNFLFDIRGVLFDERVDSGDWNKNSSKYKIGKKIEKKLFNNADEIVNLSKKGIPLIKRDLLKNKKINVSYIPTCVNLNNFKKNKKRKPLRKKLKLGNKFILTYIGSIGTWYLLEKMVDFFKELKKINKKSHFLILTGENKEKLSKKILKKIKKEDFSIVFAPHSKIKDFLSTSNAGISFIKPCYSKQFSCPTKLAEYLACELPVIINSRIGDTDQIISENKTGVIINSFNRQEYSKKIKQLIKLKKDRAIGKKCRNVAKQEYDLKKGSDKYFEIYKRLK